MSNSIETVRGHVGVYAGPELGGARTIGLQVEDVRGPSRALLTPHQAHELGVELLERSFGLAAAGRGLDVSDFRRTLLAQLRQAGPG